MTISKLKGNEKLAKNVFGDNGRILLCEGTILRENYLKILQRHGIESVYIEDEISKGIIVEKFLDESTKIESKNAIKDTFKKYFKQNEKKLDQVLDTANKIIDDIISQSDIAVNIMDLKAKDEKIFGHSVNVCALSVLAGIKMGYNMLRLKDIAIGALLHDIGKLLIPKEILNKDSELTPEEKDIYEEHPKKGYELICNHGSISSFSKVIVLLHHEKCDGSGYPKGLKKDEIHEYARLVAISNDFETMISENNNSKKMFAYEAVEYLVGMGQSLYDGNIVNEFIKNISVYPNGSGVVLNNGQKGIIKRQNKGLPTRPVVRVVYDESGKRLKQMKEIDLVSETTIFITGGTDI